MCLSKIFKPLEVNSLSFATKKNNAILCREWRVFVEHYKTVTNAICLSMFLSHLQPAYPDMRTCVYHSTSSGDVQSPLLCTIRIWSEKANVVEHMLYVEPLIGYCFGTWRCTMRCIMRCRCQKQALSIWLARCYVDIQSVCNFAMSFAFMLCTNLVPTWWFRFNFSLKVVFDLLLGMSQRAAGPLIDQSIHITIWHSCTHCTHDGFNVQVQWK